MNRESVRSSSIASVGYDPDRLVLEVEFNNGGVYQYASVPLIAHANLMKASSKGKFFDQNIRNKFKTVKVN